MSDELFKLPESQPDALAAAHKRYDEAMAALDKIEADGNDDLGIAAAQAEQELVKAAKELSRIERERYGC